MNELTPVLGSLADGTARAEDLLPVVYEELRKLAGNRMAGESSEHTLQPTALVHEAWLRLVGGNYPGWQNRAHFFSAAAEAMRRILVDHARKKLSIKRGSGAIREELNEEFFTVTAPPDELLAVHDALDELAKHDAASAELVKLRFFVGLTMDEAATAMDMSKRSAESLWTYAKVWLHRAIRESQK
jgi:RNA polymerase sigma factor (TIGR02999 family)